MGDVPIGKRVVADGRKCVLSGGLAKGRVVHCHYLAFAEYEAEKKV